MLKLLKAIPIILIASILMVLCGPSIVTKSSYTDKPLPNSIAEETTAGNEADSVNDKKGNTIADTETPAAPTGLHVLSRTNKTIELGWDKPADNAGISGYNIYKSDISPMGMNLIKNGGFESGTDGWVLEVGKKSGSSAKLTAGTERYYGQKISQSRDNGEKRQ